MFKKPKKLQKIGFKNKDRREQLVNRMSIYYRLKEIDQRESLEDFEGDTVIGKNHKGVIFAQGLLRISES